MRTTGASGFWWTVAFNLAALWVAIVLVALVGLGAGAALPAVSLALSLVAGLAALARPQSRGLGAGCLGGVAASAALFGALLIVFFGAYFLLGGRELS